MQLVVQVTRERIRQIEAKALQKLRQPNRSKVCREYCISAEAEVDIPFKTRINRGPK